jgi:hypothetical protein
MPVPVTATIQGHPWDLWGLSKLFDGSDAFHTCVEADKPEGRPTFDTNDPAAVMRFRAHGYDVFAALTSDELVWDEAMGRVDLRDIAPIAQDILARMNGIGILFDPYYKAAKLLYLTFGSGDSAGSMVHGDWTPNRDDTPLGAQQEHSPFARDALPLARTNSTVRLVLDAIALPRTWASMYLIYEAISESVGGVHKLDTMNFVHATDLKNFRNAANNNRSLSEGMRHAKKPKPGAFIPLDQAYSIINTLAVRWMQSLIAP